MKTLQKGIVPFLALALLALTACNEKPKKEIPQEPEEEEIATAPEGIISLGEAKILCDNYEDRRLGPILKFEAAQENAKENFIPTQFINFELETLKKYIKYVERKARKAKVKPDSLRIYLGNYGSKGKDENKNTVFILPTAKVNGGYGGFFINNKGNAELIRNYWPKNNKPNKTQKSEASFFPSFNMLYQEESLILNEGNSGPPPHTDF